MIDNKKLNERKIVIRPRLDESFVYKIKAKYYKETAGMSNEETIVWALERFLELPIMSFLGAGQ